MALTKCKECGKEMSSEAKACPACGAPPPKKTSLVTWLVCGFMLFVFVRCAQMGGTGTSTATAPTPKTTPAEEKEFQTVVGSLVWIKENMKNPKSFELVSAQMIGGKALCIEYRGTNSFNAVVLNRRVITDNVNSAESKDWNRECAGRSGKDYLFARRALP